MKQQKTKAAVDQNVQAKPYQLIEEAMQKKIDDISTVLCSAGDGKKRKSRLHEDVLTMVERCLFKIALKRNGNVKSAAATYLGINRNTFQKKMAKLGIDSENKR
ncbi:MAG TPA: helix-turn-helix domain-containing protein [Syntrophales bacterium]|nr:helix-turn-helix domain-containing protein [Syntrophales bacterium]